MDKKQSIIKIYDLINKEYKNSIQSIHIDNVYQKALEKFKQHAIYNEKVYAVLYSARFLKTDIEKLIKVESHEVLCHQFNQEFNKKVEEVNREFNKHEGINPEDNETIEVFAMIFLNFLQYSDNISIANKAAGIIQNFTIMNYSKEPDEKNNIYPNINRSMEIINDLVDEFIKKPLFLEEDAWGDEQATLSDVFVMPKYSFSIPHTNNIPTKYSNFLEKTENKNNSDIYNLFDNLSNNSLVRYLKDTYEKSPLINIKCIVIEGQPGIGKTSLTYKIASEYINEKLFNNKQLSIIKLRNITYSASPLESICTYLRLDKNNLQNTVFWLDGLDELSVNPTAFLFDLLTEIENIAQPKEILETYG